MRNIVKEVARLGLQQFGVTVFVGTNDAHERVLMFGHIAHALRNIGGQLARATDGSPPMASKTNVGSEHGAHRSEPEQGCANHQPDLGSRTPLTSRPTKLVDTFLLSAREAARMLQLGDRQVEQHRQALRISCPTCSPT